MSGLRAWLADLLAWLALTLMQGPLLLLIGLTVALFACWFVQDQWYRWRVRRAQRRAVRDAVVVETAVRLGELVPGQRREAD